MEAEEMEYEMEQRSQSVVSDNDNDVLRKGYQYYPITRPYQYIKETVAPVTFPNVDISWSVKLGAINNVNKHLVKLVKENKVEQVGFDSYRLNNAQNIDIRQTTTDANN
ncbi:hypothetical protein WUBG_10355 [Wuchereria bancrofti]|uniref:Uncharacterized protein n=1 Tax=Wuchereria bancrofti TaxID=6293 RepID=J9E8U0_WUCBA|nr:hypothetical protein WUBG_10355 [Wuchereria bancrofti]